MLTRDNIVLPPHEPPIMVQEAVTSTTKLNGEWKVVARRPAGQGDWEWTIPRAEVMPLKGAVEEKRVAMVQRRDKTETVLLAKLKGGKS